MNDRPSASELLEAVARFLDREAVPALSGPLRYQARVSANVVRIVAREIASEEQQLRGEWQRLAALLDESPELPAERDVLKQRIGAATACLVQRIRAGEADRGAWREAVFAHLERTVADKLEVALGRSGEES